MSSAVECGVAISVRWSAPVGFRNNVRFMRRVRARAFICETKFCLSARFKEFGILAPIAVASVFAETLSEARRAQ